LLLVALCVLGVGALWPAGSLAAGSTAQRSTRDLGLIYKGLHPGSRQGSCHGASELHVRGGTACTDGPDPAPAGASVLPRRAVAALRASGGMRTLSAKRTVRCIGDGSSGPRVQAIYAYAAGQASRYSSVAPLIQKWAADVDSVFNLSAAETGGSRHVRFVTDTGCRPVVLRVTLSSAGDDTLQNTINELRTLGYNRSDRKYLVWMDANVYCGIAETYNDDRPTEDNRNNGHPGVPGMVARVDNSCWGLLSKGPGSSIEAHELTHTLGAVMSTSPNHTGHGHCSDESDAMCYADGSGVPMRWVCPRSHEKRLDCKHDDYFSTNPPAGSYLATHWNVASSAFLAVESGFRPHQELPKARNGQVGTSKAASAGGSSRKSGRRTFDPKLMFAFEARWEAPPGGRGHLLLKPDSEIAQSANRTH